ncbi:MAG: UDP-N-acetylmuramoyl-tripeptide--D-alanyl-D-alanine ligase [Ginsengibacter sp.]
MRIEEIYEIFLQYPSIQTDSRMLQKNDLFFALKGDSFNGNLFAEQAIKKGAAFVFVDEKIPFTDERIIQTDDVLKTLQDLAKFHRQQFNNLPGRKTQVPFIAVTGSNGKTTTKELLHEVLSSTYKTYTTQGNLNNHIGIPITILKVKPDAEMAVIEMGANHLKEIAGYCEYAMPTHGLITNIGKAHLEGFGGMENVKKGKGELFDYLRDHGGTTFVNADDNAVVELSNGIGEVVFYGNKGNGVLGTITRSDPFLEVHIDAPGSLDIKTNLVGAYNSPNVLAAVCIGRYFKVDDERIQKAIENYNPSNSRSQLIKQNSNTIILDAYNANPSSMKAAIENFAAMEGDKKILLLGAMMELGRESTQEHAAVISIIDNYKWEAVVLVGESFGNLKHKYINYDTALQAKEWLEQQHFENAQILIKGSRIMQMEKVLE